MIFRKGLAFLIRDFRTQTSYRLAFITSFAGIFVSVAMFFFLSKLMGKGLTPYLAEYSGNYFAYVIIGISLSGFMGTGLGVFSSSISSAQAQGTLEAMLVTPTRLPEIVGFSSIWSFIFTAINMVVYLAFGVIFFGLRFGNANIPAALIVLLLLTVIFSGIGIMSASFVMVLKRGNPLDWIFGSASSILGGTFFPTQVLPAWLQKFSYLFPVFYALRAMRLALIKGASLMTLAPDILVLGAFALVTIPFSILCFKYAVRQAKIDGSLATY